MPGMQHKDSRSLALKISILKAVKHSQKSVKIVFTLCFLSFLEKNLILHGNF